MFVRKCPEQNMTSNQQVDFVLQTVSLGNKLNKHSSNDMLTPSFVVSQTIPSP